ncbi:uncharacterized protein N7515_009123 [Penicillium bovifimosum]|uniref:Clr5 domain-containing protein n=1 Tax=Penicillium bovifimosum TaxID=126998 RepID=A0A9W9KV75_9EURO|nr:uncharacterized protein N7515_009123 [Penicillium bovifimosum]KAJ5121162.1 hypothetical protein N7515_009123 [Penicillium bovifimosum]
MKTSISSDVWEKKKALIAKLYMEEEWPLKQVIKQIRTDDFNPSETQLRSRLKKWRVTKPSRQTRKKSLASEAEPKTEVKHKPSTVQRPLPSLPTRETSTSHEWPMSHPIYGQPSALPRPIPDQDEDRKWSPPMTQQLTPSPSGDHVLAVDRTPAVSYDHSPTTTSFDHAHTSPVTQGLMVNTTSAIAPSYPAYPLSPESCLTSPAPTTTATTPAGVSWSPRAVSVDYGLNPSQWYSLPFEAITPPATVSQSTAPMTPEIQGYLPGQNQMYHPQYHHYQGTEYPHEYSDRNWKRALSLQYDMAGHPARSEHEGKNMQPHIQFQHSLPSMSHSQIGPHSVMCAPIMPYMGHDQVQKPPGIGY